MEENKTPEKNGDKQQHRRRHGYFIQPPTAENTKPAPQQSGEKKAENSNKVGEKKPHHHHKNNHHRTHKPRPEAQNGEQNAEKKAETQSLAPEAKTEQKPNNNQAPSQNKKKKKNHPQKKKPESPVTDGAEVKAQKTTDAHAPTQSKKRFPGDKLRRDDNKIEHSADDYEEYSLSFDDDNESGTSGENEEAERTEVVGIRFKSTGKVYYFDPQGKTYQKGSKAIVDTARGQEFGEVAMTNGFVRSSDIVPPLRPVVRAATEEDIEHNKLNKKKEETAFKICNEKIVAHNLDMKLIEAQYTFDNSKLLFYFTSSDRVDFRGLVKDLAAVFRTRIELRQIGIRDEAKLMGGLGMCGRPLCCTLFLSDFDQVSIKMAKEQNLSLNSAKISGICGRLMCCLRYEHEAYEYEIKRTPPVDSLVRTADGDGVVTEISPLQATIKVKLISSPDAPPKTYKRDDVTMLRKKNS